MPLYFGDAYLKDAFSPLREKFKIYADKRKMVLRVGYG